MPPTTTGKTLDKETILALDPYLVENVPAIQHRYESFAKWKENIEQNEGGYDKFTQGYLKLGFHVAEDGTVTYREWAPDAIEAVVIGEFSE
jgi:1,4-alpha-glucan branching enzyme